MANPILVNLKLPRYITLYTAPLVKVKSDRLFLSIELGTVQMGPERLTRLGNSNVLRLPVSAVYLNALVNSYAKLVLRLT